MNGGHKCRPQLYFLSIANSIFSKLDLDLSSHSDLDSYSYLNSYLNSNLNLNSYLNSYCNLQP